MNILHGRERIILHALSSVLLGSAVSMDEMDARINRSLGRATRMMRLGFRLALHLFDWGTYFLVTGDGRWAHFSCLSWKAKQRYVRFWMNHRSTIVRQLFTLLKVLVVAPHYDQRIEAARVGYAPHWLARP